MCLSGSLARRHQSLAISAVLSIAVNLIATSREVNSEQNLSGIAIGFEGRKQEIGEAEHASKEHAQECVVVSFGSEAFTPSDPSGTQQKVDEKVGVKLRPPVERYQIVGRNAWPIDSIRKRSNQRH